MINMASNFKIFEVRLVNDIFGKASWENTEATFLMFVLFQVRIWTNDY